MTDGSASPRGTTSVVLTAPRDGTPEPVTTPAGLTRAAKLLAAGTGPVAVDAERASGYRYTHRAYLVQLRREGAGTILIDPLPFADLSEIAEAIADAEWVLHAASQDLPCLAEIGMLPAQLFDTELAAPAGQLGPGRVGRADRTAAGFRVGEAPLGRGLVDPAAADVVAELRRARRRAAGRPARPARGRTDRQDKLEWAREEFAALVASAGRPPPPRTDPWRRTSGIHKVRGARALARVRALWYARDRIAARRDAAPGRVLPDAAIVAAAEMDPADERELLAVPGFGGRSVRRLAPVWLDALAEARALTERELPQPPAADGPPPPHRWAERDPVAAARLARCREVVTRLATEHSLPPENLVAPDAIRRLAWTPPRPVDAGTAGAALAATGVRPWQVGLLADELAVALIDPGIHGCRSVSAGRPQPRRLVTDE